MNNIPSNMAGVLLVGHGGPEMLEYRTDIARPDPLPNQVLVRVESAGVNNTDINTRIGWYSKDGDDDDATWSGKPLEFPRIQGADVCGVIVAVGDNVANDRLGERVIIDPCLFEGDDEAVIMKTGDYINIPAHRKHRVEWTDPEEDTIWLAIHY